MNINHSQSKPTLREANITYSRSEKNRRLQPPSAPGRTGSRRTSASLTRAKCAGRPAQGRGRAHPDAGRNTRFANANRPFQYHSAKRSPPGGASASLGRSGKLFAAAHIHRKGPLSFPAYAVPPATAFHASFPPISSYPYFPPSALNLILSASFHKIASFFHMVVSAFSGGSLPPS